MSYTKLPIEEIINRLTYHTADSSRLLYPLKFHEYPLSEIRGLTDLPWLMLMLPDVSYETRPTNIVETTMEVRLILSAKRKDGIPAWLTWMDRVLNAIETTRDGNATVDGSLGGTLRGNFRGDYKEFTAKAAEPFVLDLSLNGQITLSLQLKHRFTGAR